MVSRPIRRLTGQIWQLLARKVSYLSFLRRKFTLLQREKVSFVSTFGGQKCRISPALFTPRMTDIDQSITWHGTSEQKTGTEHQNRKSKRKIKFLFSDLRDDMIDHG